MSDREKPHGVAFSFRSVGEPRIVAICKEDGKECLLCGGSRRVDIYELKGLDCPTCTATWRRSENEAAELAAAKRARDVCACVADRFAGSPSKGFTEILGGALEVAAALRALSGEELLAKP
jgi:hypothetical protein